MKTEEQHVNGPFNAVRLEGKIGDINKVVYLFMDVHKPVYDQTECENIRSIDIDKFLINTFDQALDNGKTYDLFSERDPIHPLYDDPIYRENYFQQITKLLHKASKIDPKTGEVGRSEELKNVRLHYADLRRLTTLKYLNMWSFIQQLIDNFWNTQRMKYDDILDIKDGLNLLYSHIMSIYKLFYEEKDIEKTKKSRIIFSDKNISLSEYTDKEYQDILQNLVYKLLKSYNHKEVQDGINKIINDELHDAFKMFFEDISKAIEKVNEIEKILHGSRDNILKEQRDGTYHYGIDSSVMIEYIYELDNILSKIDGYLKGIPGLFLMDLYLLRRLLDKNYVTNAVVYTGSAHSLDYIRLLVKYFGFKITHYSYLKGDNITAVEKYIKNTTNHDQLNEYFYPPELVQCSILRDWPKNFL